MNPTHLPMGSVPGQNTQSASLGEASASVDSVMTTDAETRARQRSNGAIEEPLVLDVAAMHEGYDTIQQQPPLAPSTPKQVRERQDSWLSDEDRDLAAPSPPNIPRRDIHIPLRTR